MQVQPNLYMWDTRCPKCGNRFEYTAPTSEMPFPSPFCRMSAADRIIYLDSRPDQVVRSQDSVFRIRVPHIVAMLSGAAVLLSILWVLKEFSR